MASPSPPPTSTTGPFTRVITALSAVSLTPERFHLAGHRLQAAVDLGVERVVDLTAARASHEATFGHETIST